MDLKAKKSFKYRGRALVPGEPFKASRAHGKVLTAVGKAELGTLITPQVSVQTKRRSAMDDDGNGTTGGSRRQPPSPALVAARADYKLATGKAFFSGWGVDELRARIAAHKAAQAQAE